jgi:hypothetical protein
VSQGRAPLSQPKVRKTLDTTHDEAVFHVVKGMLLRTDDWRPDDKYKNRTTLVKAAIRYLDKFKDDKAKTMIMEDGKPGSRTQL